jgi:hypothetical protein
LQFIQILNIKYFFNGIKCPSVCKINHRLCGQPNDGRMHGKDGMGAADPLVAGFFSRCHSFPVPWL